MSDVALLHAQVDELEAQGANWQRIMVVHALIDAGYTTVIECAMPRCIYDSREFDPNVRSLALSIDHITPLSQGGTHHADNLRIAHLGCNSAAAAHNPEASHRKSITLARTRRAQKYAQRNVELKEQVSTRNDVWLERWQRETTDWLWLESTRKLQSTVYHVNYEDLQGEQLADYVIWNHTALVSELTEFMDEIQWKNWAKERGRVNRDEAVGELVDVGHFLANLLVALGVTDVEWEVRYREKQLRNAERQAAPGGYSGEKCPQCRRELDRVGALISRDGFGTGGKTFLHCAHCNAVVRERVGAPNVDYCASCYRDYSDGIDCTPHNVRTEERHVNGVRAELSMYVTRSAYCAYV